MSDWIDKARAHSKAEAMAWHEREASALNEEHRRLPMYSAERHELSDEGLQWEADDAWYRWMGEVL